MIDDDDLRGYEEEDDSMACPRCGDSGKVPTADYESYFGAMYKPCPLCRENLCEGEPGLS